MPQCDFRLARSGENKCESVVFVIKKRKQAKMPFSPLVRAVGLEPTLFRTCPLNMRVCHSATPAQIMLFYYSRIFLKSQQFYAISHFFIKKLRFKDKFPLKIGLK